MRLLATAASAALALAAPRPAAAAEARDAALARFAEQVPGLFRVEPAPAPGPREYAIEPAPAPLPVLVTGSGADNVTADGRCKLDGVALRLAFEAGLAEVSLPLAGEDEPSFAHLVVTADTGAFEGGRCYDVLTAQVSLSRRVAGSADGSTFVFAPLLYADSRLVAHRPRDYPAAELARVVAEVVDDLAAALDDGGGGDAGPSPQAPPEPAP